MTSLETARAAAKALCERKGEDIKVIRIRDIFPFQNREERVIDKIEQLVAGQRGAGSVVCGPVPPAA